MIQLIKLTRKEDPLQERKEAKWEKKKRQKRIGKRCRKNGEMTQEKKKKGAGMKRKSRRDNRMIWRRNEGLKDHIELMAEVQESEMIWKLVQDFMQYAWKNYSASKIISWNSHVRIGGAKVKGASPIKSRTIMQS